MLIFIFNSIHLKILFSCSAKFFCFFYSTWRSKMKIIFLLRKGMCQGDYVDYVQKYYNKLFCNLATQVNNMYSCITLWHKD